TALGALARYASPRANFQVAYTWSHSIDNQSEALLGDPFDLSRFNPENAGSAQVAAPLNRRADRGSSDFDLRHNLVFYSMWQLPSARGGWMRHVTSGWQFAQLADFRTGLPYTVFNEVQSDVTLKSRPDLVPGVKPLTRTETNGGVRLLDSKAFADPAV